MATFKPAVKKRKRDSQERDGDGGPSARSAQAAKRSRSSHLQHADAVKHALLAQYYPNIRTLREYVLSKLPDSSRLRRRKIVSVGQVAGSPETPASVGERVLGTLLDETFVAFHDVDAKSRPDNRWQQWIEYSQRGDESYVTLSDGPGGAIFSQSEVVDFVVWLLFYRQSGASWPKHLLCDGFRKNNKPQGGGQPAGPDIPGLFVVHYNRRSDTLKQSPWPELLMLLGKAGEQIMMDLLLDCAIFTPLEAGKGNLYQLSGPPISELQLLTDVSLDTPPGELTSTEITFVRSRMMYARAALNARGLVHFGLRHIHVLNRFPVKKSAGTAARAEYKVYHDDENTVRVMMHIFPRQFGLHDAFTSVVDRRQTAQKFQDYTLREEEIARKFVVTEGDTKSFKVSVPKRLRGMTKELVRRLQVLHERCSYAELLRYYCPVPESVEAAQQQRQGQNKSRQSLGAVPTAQDTSLVELATPIAAISTFCQAVLAQIIPGDFWGEGSTQEENKKAFLKKVDHFIRLRRFETMTLHEAAQGIKFTNLGWLTPPNLKNQKCSLTDTRKRKEIFHEFLYYVFDSLLIPLVRSNFYVTESNLHRYRLFFFRHDVWRYIAEPAMAFLKAKMFEEVKLDSALRILDSRRIGFSQVRLLPKERAMRPIMNLRRRALLKGNKKVLGPSINSALQPVASVLRFEKALHPDRLGSALFSVGDIYDRIKAFKRKLGTCQKKLYFAKVDVQAAFDTIPQEAIIDLMRHVPGEAQYKLVKHVEIQLAENTHGNAHSKKTIRRWHSLARAAGDTTPFLEAAGQELGLKRKNTVFLDSVVQKPFDTKGLMALMTSHIQQNLVKIGKKFYRQKDGIPQGSVLSSTLCNYFYADLEKRHLSFLPANDCLLLRLIDDFILISTDKDKAARFVKVMHKGLPEYGVTVNPSKSLVNFEMAVNGAIIPRLRYDHQFPYCGTLIDCSTLDVSKDRERSRDPVIFNSLTIEFSRFPGKNFKRKLLNAFKIQSHLMFFDTSHNSQKAVLTNIYTAFIETATKMWAYARCLPKMVQPSNGIVIESVKELIDVAVRLLSSNSRKLRYPGYEFNIKKAQVAWLATVAFRELLTKKQTRYKAAIAWLDEETRKLSARKDIDCRAMVNIAKGSSHPHHL